MFNRTTLGKIIAPRRQGRKVRHFLILRALALFAPLRESSFLCSLILNSRQIQTSFASFHKLPEIHCRPSCCRSRKISWGQKGKEGADHESPVSGDRSRRRRSLLRA